MKDNKVQVMINGREYTMSGEESEAYLYRLGHYVDRKVQEVRRAYSRLNDADAAVMAAIVVADELLKLQDENAMIKSRATGAAKAEGADLSLLETPENVLNSKDDKAAAQDFLTKSQNKNRIKK